MYFKPYLYIKNWNISREKKCIELKICQNQVKKFTIYFRKWRLHRRLETADPETVADLPGVSVIKPICQSQECIQIQLVFLSLFLCVSLSLSVMYPSYSLSSGRRDVFYVQYLTYRERFYHYHGVQITGFFNLSVELCGYEFQPPNCTNLGCYRCNQYI